jgi:hypothetical protein
MKSRWYLILVIILGLALFSSLAVPVAAAAPSVKLVLGGTGTTSWNIGGIKPGDTGTQLITIFNNGTDAGNLTVWVSNIINTEGTDPKFEPGPASGDLGKYLTFTILSSRMTSNISMPALVNSLPQNAADAHYIKVLSLAAGETINIDWNWNLPPGTGNVVQGDSLSYIINYALEDLPPISPAPAPPAPPLPAVPTFAPPSPLPLPEIAGVGITMSVPSGIVSGSPKSYIMDVTNTAAVTLNDLTVIFVFPESLSYQSSIPLGTVTGNRIIWDLSALDIGEMQEITVVLGGISSDASVFIATVTTREGAKAGASVNATVLSTSTPPPQLIMAPGIPAVFEVHNLTVNPIQAKPGETITISYEVINTGGQTGEFKLMIDIHGLLQTSQLIKLEAGEAQTMSLTLPPVDPGTYPVEIGGEEAAFTVGTLPPALPVSTASPKVNRYLLIPLILVVIGEAVVVIYIVIFMKRRHRTRHQMRVAELASAIAREMNLSNKLVKMLLLFGILRDPDLIESPYPEAKTAIQYNRRLKGSGYPQKLAGDNILLEARIMAVADMFETISSPRPNRPAIGLDQALEEFSRSKSALYAADVVQALIRLVKQGNFKFRTQYS